MVLIQEMIVIDDLLSALTGIDGRYISIKKSGGGEDAFSFHVDGSMDLALQARMLTYVESAKRIFPLCKSYLLINQFVESRSQFKSGLVNHAFAAALRALLLDYQAMVAQLEHQFRLGRLSIRAVNEPNVQRTVREPFGGKFVYVRSFNKRTNMNKKFRSIS
ncbi:putative gamma-tubulin complex component protein [Helianthus annuus]|nr:putative gamma-tubulin complex component protein [Helianthus annuus]